MYKYYLEVNGVRVFKTQSYEELEKAYNRVRDNHKYDWLSVLCFNKKYHTSEETIDKCVIFDSSDYIYSAYSQGLEAAKKIIKKQICDIRRMLNEIY